MMWAALFAIGVAQGIFLISVILARRAKNRLAAIFISGMVAIMVLTNLGYFTIHTSLVIYLPQLFVLPFGMIFLYGPLLYFYSRAASEPGFEWRRKNWWHIVPYLLQLLINLPMLLADNTVLKEFIAVFLSGKDVIRTPEKIIFLAQDLHLFIYLFVTMKRLLQIARKENPQRLMTAMPERIKWLKMLVACFASFLLTMLALYVFTVINGNYVPVANYLYTLVTTGIIYIVAYRLVFEPELISPDFAVKYQAYKQFDDQKGEDYVNRIRQLMDNRKLYLDAELKINDLAGEIGLPSHQLSKLINEKFGKSFSELVNEYRVKEFISRVNEPGYLSFSIYGLALEVGFNSKSSFNSTFKKITGKNPSDFKKS